MRTLPKRDGFMVVNYKLWNGKEYYRQPFYQPKPATDEYKLLQAYLAAKKSGDFARVHQIRDIEFVALGFFLLDEGPDRNMKLTMSKLFLWPLELEIGRARGLREDVFINFAVGAVAAYLAGSKQGAKAESIAQKIHAAIRGGWGEKFCG